MDSNARGTQEFEQAARGLDAIHDVALDSSTAETERERWARELHVEALDALSGLARLLREALRQDDLRVARPAITEAVERLEQEMQNLGALEAELQPEAPAMREPLEEPSCRSWAGRHPGRLVPSEASRTWPPAGP